MSGRKDETLQEPLLQNSDNQMLEELATKKAARNHTVSGNLVTTAEGVAGLSNGAATGYAQNGTYPFSAASSDGDVGLPSVHLKQCQKN
mgnify:CR=1 FL=1